MDIVEVLARWAEFIVAGLAVLSAVWYGIRRMYKMAKNIETLISLTHQNAADIKAVKAQLFTNGGSSLRDAVDRIEKRVKVLETHDERAS